MSNNRKPIRVVTINSWKGNGAYTRRLAAMASQLRFLQPEVICLQEALQSTDEQFDTAGYLARSLNMQMIYAPCRRKIRAVEGKQIDCHSGLAVLTSLPVCCSSITSLPSAAPDDERISHTVEIEAAGGPLVITNVHLTHLEGADALRCRQFIAAIEHGQPLDYSTTWLCCGDFNFAVEEALRQVERSTGWLPFDCYTAGGGQMPGATLPGGDLIRPGKRLDYILGLVRESADVFLCDKSRIVLDHPDNDGYFPSDHFGVMVEITQRVCRGD
jgi:endonuclease/exonuclease/phosphatase family metal-dependent hydrolase